MPGLFNNKSDLQFFEAVYQTHIIYHYFFFRFSGIHAELIIDDTDNKHYR